jgi:hypothetical protein
MAFSKKEHTIIKIGSKFVVVAFPKNELTTIKIGSVSSSSQNNELVPHNSIHGTLLKM